MHDPAARLRSILAVLDVSVLPPRLLNVGCGAWSEAPALAEGLPGWALYGLDLDRDALRRAAGGWPSLRLVQADARDLPGLLRARFGLVLVRHPDLYRRPAWGAILPALAGCLAPKGALLITLYAAEEIERVRTLPLPPGLLLDEGHLAPPDLSGADRYALLCRA